MNRDCQSARLASDSTAWARQIGGHRLQLVTGWQKASPSRADAVKPGSDRDRSLGQQTPCLLENANTCGFVHFVTGTEPDPKERSVESKVMD